MINTGKIKLIIAREYLTRVRKKSFILMTILGPLLIAGLLSLAIWLGTKDDDSHHIMVVDETPGLFGKLPDTKLIAFSNSGLTLEEAKKTFHETAYSAILYLPKNIIESNAAILFFKKQPGAFAQRSVEKILEGIIEDAKLEINKIDKEKYMSIKTSVTLNTISYKEQGREEEVDRSAAFIGFFFAVLIYIFIFLYGVQVMRGVIEEKTSRIIEVIISSVKPFELMMGKIIGVALVGLTQFILWIVLTIILFLGVQTILFEGKYDPKQMQEQMTTEMQMKSQSSEAIVGMDPYNPMSMISRINFPLMIGMFLFYFLGGYLLYSSLFAAVGAAVDSEADTQQFMAPLTIPLVFGFIIAEFMIMNPEGSTAFWFSIIPLTSPVVMMVRIAVGVGGGGVPVWEVALSALLLVLGFIATVWMAAKIYRVGILMYGKKAGYRELWKWITY